MTEETLIKANQINKLIGEVAGVTTAITGGSTSIRISVNGADIRFENNDVDEISQNSFLAVSKILTAYQTALQDQLNSLWFKEG